MRKTYLNKILMGNNSLFIILGIVLCNLLNYLVPGIINYTDVSFRPQKSRVRYLKN